MLIPESPNPQICTSTSNRQIAGKVQRATNQPKNNLDRPRPLLAPNLSQNLYHPPTDLNWTRNCQEENCDRQSIKKYLIFIRREGKNENMTKYLSACRLGPPFNFKWNPMSALRFSFNSVDRASANDPSWLSLISLSIWYHHSQNHIITLQHTSSLSILCHRSQTHITTLTLVSSLSNPWQHSQ